MCCFYCHSCVCRNLRKHICKSKVFTRSQYKFVSVTESPEDPQDLWVNITFPENEERQIKLMEYAAELETDILLNYGYHIMLMPATKREIALAAKKQKMPI